jgi:hypothetical protein
VGRIWPTTSWAWLGPAAEPAHGAQAMAQRARAQGVITTHGAGGAALAETSCGLRRAHKCSENVALGTQRGGGTHLSGLSTAAGGDEAARRSSSRVAALR